MRSDGISSGKTRSSAAADISFQPTAEGHARQSASGRISAADMLQKVYLEVTTDCNLSCGMCMRHSWEDPICSMSSETFEALISQLHQMPSVSTVNFSGFGEPTVHPQFFEFLLKVKEAGLSAGLVTNGTTLEMDVLEELLELELDKLVVSLDGAGSSADASFHSESIDRIHCFGNGFPCCGECLWAAGLVRCP